VIIIDFETRSRSNLLDEGADKYASDPTTDILCMAAHDLPTGKEWLWFPSDGPLPDDLVQAIESADLVAAHNARFDQLIWECVGVSDYSFPMLPANKWYCTSAQCRVNALPASLDDAARALGLVKRKDHRGKALIRKLSIPNPATGEFNEDAEAVKQMGEYCLQDVRVTVDVVTNTRLMMQQEHGDWLVNERINDRGVEVDIKLCEYALRYAEQETAEIAHELTDATDYYVTKHTQSARIRDWLYDQLPADHPALKMTVRYVKNERKISVDKQVRADILNAADNQIFEIPDKVYNGLSLIDDGNKSSVAKFKRMIGRAESDRRCRGSFVYAGATQTLRYASRGLQLHNMKRACWSVDEAIGLRALMVKGARIDGNVSTMEALAKLLRPAMIPEEGKCFVVGDWSAIEARGLPYLSDSEGGDRKLDIFREGKDVYIEASNAMGLDDRQLGKVSELSLGYGGGVGAFDSMGRNYGVKLPEQRVKGIVKRWRAANQWAVEFWNALFDAARAAIRHPGETFTAGRLKYYYLPQLMNGTLICELPDGTALQYPFCRIEMVDTEWGTKPQITALKASYTMPADATEWPRVNLWRGLLAENVTQAFCAALLRNTLRQLDHVVAHVHDEVILEVPVKIATSVKEELQCIMESPPEWAQGLPLKAEPAIMMRYGK
jgi:DNA polymerase